MWDSKSKKTRFCTTYEHVFMAFMSFECKLFNFQLNTKTNRNFNFNRRFLFWIFWDWTF